MSTAEPNVPESPPRPNERTRTGTSVPALKWAILDNLFFVQGRFPDSPP